MGATSAGTSPSAFVWGSPVGPGGRAPVSCGVESRVGARYAAAGGPAAALGLVTSDYGLPDGATESPASHADPRVAPRAGRPGRVRGGARAHAHDPVRGCGPR